MQEEGGWRGTAGTGIMGVRLLDVITGGFGLCMHNPGPAWEKYAEYASTGYCLEVGVQAQCLASKLVHTCDDAPLGHAGGAEADKWALPTTEVAPSK